MKIIIIGLIIGWSIALFMIYDMIKNWQEYQRD